MKTTKNKSILPLRLRKAIANLGADIAVARRKRSLTVAMMTERIGVHKNTYLKIEKGDQLLHSEFTPWLSLFWGCPRVLPP